METPYTLLDGKEINRQMREEIKAEVEKMVAQGHKSPRLIAVLVGHDGGSETYVHNKMLTCEACGIRSETLRFEADITEEELLRRSPSSMRTTTSMASSSSYLCPSILMHRK